MSLEIRDYGKRDEREWVRCHIFVDLEATAGELLKEKPKYDGKTVELVATIDGKIIGFLDIELEDSPGRICHKKVEGNGMLWHIGVSKDCRRQGIGTKLLNEGMDRAVRYGLRRLEAWTVEESAKPFYEKYGFNRFYEYHQIRVNKRRHLKSFDRDEIHVVSLFGHVLPEAGLEDIVRKYEPKEVLACTGFEKAL